MKKRLLVLFVAFLQVVSLAACGGSGSGGANTSATATASSAASATVAPSEKPFPITMMYIVNAEGEDFPKVQSAISDLAQKEINMTVKLVATSFGNFQQQQQLMLSGNEPLDVMVMFGGNASSYISNGSLVDMAPLIDKYGQDIIKQLGEDIAKAPRINGFQYMVPGYKEYTYPGGVNMRTDILKECNIDTAGIKSFQDLTNVYKTVKQKYPNMDMIASDFISMIQLNYFDSLTDSFGVLLADGDSTKVVNWFESDKYKELANLIRSWYKEGFVKKDLATSTETAEAVIKAGNAFSFFCPQKPNTAQEKAGQTGYDMTCIELAPRYMSTSDVAGIGYAIAANTKDPEKAMKFLNWTYASPGFMNLINWGIEGENYVVVDKENGIIDFPEGQNVQTCKYHQDLGWALPNQGIAYLWKGNQPDVWEKYKEFNASAKRSVALGFAYDPTTVTDEIAACTAVLQKYQKSIGTGSVDPNEYIPKFNKELYNAGLQKIIDAKQSQLDAWLANNKK